MVTDKEILAKFLKQKRAYARFDRTIRRVYKGRTFDEFCRIVDMDLALSVIVKDCGSRDKAFFQKLDHQWQKYWAIYQKGIEL